MNIKTKFDLDQYVWVTAYSCKEISEECPVCHGKGMVVLESESFSCPKCYGDGYISKVLPKEWRILYKSQVGKIRVEMYKEDGILRIEETYMLKCTGSPHSGAIWKAEDLYGSRAEAQKACDEKNADMERQKEFITMLSSI